MKNELNVPLTVDPIEDDKAGLTAAELCHTFQLSADQLKELVDEGLIEPLIQEEGQWRFQGASLRRIHYALRLNRDLGVNWAGAALALELLDELKRLRIRLQRYEPYE